jgi:hypothetical protein
MQTVEKAASSSRSNSLKLKICLGNIRNNLFQFPSLIHTCRTEKSMQPTSEATKLEGANAFVEYRAAKKLEDKKALITGGEYALAVY